MRTVELLRVSTGKSGTFGELKTDTGFKCRTGELPWSDNIPDISCLKQDDYLVTWGMTGTHGECFRLEDKNERTGILIHAGNFCGNISDGYKSDVKGCIILGQSIGTLDGQIAIISSHQALKAFEADMGKQSFLLSIKWANDLFNKLNS